MKVGVVVGTFDLFHIGHLNLLESAAEKCDFLIAGVNRDHVVLRDKSKHTIISEQHRLRIVSSIRHVSAAFLVDNNAVDFIKWLIENNHNPEIYFRGNEPEKPHIIKENEKITKMAVKVFMFPYTDSVSSSIIRDKLNQQ